MDVHAVFLILGYVSLKPHASHIVRKIRDKLTSSVGNARLGGIRLLLLEKRPELAPTSCSPMRMATSAPIRIVLGSRITTVACHERPH